MEPQAPSKPRPQKAPGDKWTRSYPANYGKAVFADPGRLPSFKGGKAPYLVLKTRYGVSFLKKMFLALDMLNMFIARLRGRSMIDPCFLRDVKLFLGVVRPDPVTTPPNDRFAALWRNVAVSVRRASRNAHPRVCSLLWNPGT